jgi:hypothetical protein
VRATVAVFYQPRPLVDGRVPVRYPGRVMFRDTRR